MRAVIVLESEVVKLSLSLSTPRYMKRDEEASWDTRRWEARGEEVVDRGKEEESDEGKEGRVHGSAGARSWRIPQSGILLAHTYLCYIPGR